MAKCADVRVTPTRPHSSSHRGKFLSCQHLSNWIVEVIVFPYESRGLQPPGSLRAQSTRVMATSWTLFRRMSASDICAAASWASPHTLIWFYCLDVHSNCALAHGEGMWCWPSRAEVLWASERAFSFKTSKVWKRMFGYQGNPSSLRTK